MLMTGNEKQYKPPGMYVIRDDELIVEIALKALGQSDLGGATAAVDLPAFQGMYTEDLEISIEIPVASTPKTWDFYCFICGDGEDFVVYGEAGDFVLQVAIIRPLSIWGYTGFAQYDSMLIPVVRLKLCDALVGSLDIFADAVREIIRDRTISYIPFSDTVPFGVHVADCIPYVKEGLMSVCGVLSD